jgi:hypothetical protein
MKTKIIYISGNEIFEMAEIRAAFDEVRSALGLDKDTILFGVPVDADNAIEIEKQTDSIEEVVCTAQIEPETPADNIIIANETDITPENISDTTTDFIDETDITEPIVENTIDTETESEPEIPESTKDAQEQESNASEPEIDMNEKIIPILSVLGGKITEDTKSEPESDTTTETVSITNIDATEDMIVVQNIEITDNSEKITEMINEDAPVANVEKTLEQLLESMTPLCEDAEPQEIVDDTPYVDDIDAEMATTIDDTDATLAQLASEFAETEDKIVDEPKTTSGGKIGKLKNILPFKKAKRDDGGLMGDLFGWAGIAANDDDFSIPGFFTKKQGA